MVVIMVARLRLCSTFFYLGHVVSDPWESLGGPKFANVAFLKYSEALISVSSAVQTRWMRRTELCPCGGLDSGHHMSKCNHTRPVRCVIWNDRKVWSTLSPSSHCSAAMAGQCVCACVIESVNLIRSNAWLMSQPNTVLFGSTSRAARQHCPVEPLTLALLFFSFYTVHLARFLFSPPPCFAWHSHHASAAVVVVASIVLLTADHSVASDCSIFDWFDWVLLADFEFDCRASGNQHCFKMRLQLFGCCMSLLNTTSSVKNCGAQLSLAIVGTLLTCK